MHSTLGVEAAAGREGWMHAAVAFAKPFRMPDFFLISGLFLARVIDRDWRDYLDRKVVHFAYFYVLWVTIQFAFKAPMFAAEHGLARRRPCSISKPSSSRSARCGSSICCRSSSSSSSSTRGRAAGWRSGWSRAALEIAHDPHRLDRDRRVRAAASSISTPAICSRRTSSRWRRACSSRPAAALVGLAVWALVNGALVFGGYADLPFVSLALGLRRRRRGGRGRGAAGQERSCSGRCAIAASNSIVIYLAFFLPMAATRIVLLKTGIITDLGTVSLLVTLAGVIGALCCSGRCAARRSASCSSGRPGRGSSPRDGPRCSRRNDSQRSLRAH